MYKLGATLGKYHPLFFLIQTSPKCLGLYCQVLVLPSPQPDILPVRPSHLVNKIDLHVAPHLLLLQLPENRRPLYHTAPAVLSQLEPWPCKTEMLSQEWCLACFPLLLWCHVGATSVSTVAAMHWDLCKQRWLHPRHWPPPMGMLLHVRTCHGNLHVLIEEPDMTGICSWMTLGGPSCRHQCHWMHHFLSLRSCRHLLLLLEYPGQ